MSHKNVFKTMKEGADGTRYGKYGSVEYSSRYKRGRSPSASRKKREEYATNEAGIPIDTLKMI